MCLAQVLGQIPKYHDPNLLVGFETADDAGVFRLDDRTVLVQTVDFFTPVVDDPHAYGAIAAANALSDVYAMGGTPRTAMAIACFPEKGDLDLLASIMRGGAEKLHEAGVTLLGGHTVSDPEIKFGYAVTGTIDPSRMLTNAGAQPGDSLVLTKPLGIGIITSGIKFQKTTLQSAAAAVRLMCTLNRKAAEIMLRYRSHAATDVTGNGLLGHAFEMAQGSRVTLRIEASKVPFLPEARSLAEARVLPGAVRKNWQLVQANTSVAPEVPDPLRNILLDPQTSGGLLISLSPQDLPALLRDMEREGVETAAVIGAVQEMGKVGIVVVG